MLREAAKKSRWRVPLTAVTCALVLLAGVGTASYRIGEQQAADAALDLPSSFAVVDDLYERIQAEAVAPPGGDALYDSALDGALEGLLTGLDDPYAAYYDVEAFADLSDSLDGTVSGVGIVVEPTEEGLMVLTVLEGTPASRAGIQAGDTIVSVDGRNVRDEPADVVVDLITGEAGTSVTVGVDGPAGLRDLTMTRAVIQVPNLETELLDDGTGYLQLRQFAGDVSVELRAEVEDLLAQGATGFVLDLRDNPGGLLDEAVEVASVFVEEGTIVEVRAPDQDSTVLSAEGEAFEDVPLVVLVNGSSASASEIVAGAIQDLDRAPIIGLPTFGKGTVQTVRPLPNGGGYKFTTAEYFTPSGDSIEDVGVQPDQTVEGADAQLTAAQETLRMLTAAR